jgi:hypothetical protein
MHKVKVTLLSGNPGSISLSINLPNSVGVYSLTPSSGTPPFTSTLIITTLNIASPSNYSLTLTASPINGPAKTTSLTLRVTASAKLTLELNPEIVPRGSPLTISGHSPIRVLTIT